MLFRASLAVTLGTALLSPTGASAAPASPSLRAPSNVILVQRREQQDDDKQKGQRDQGKAKSQPGDKGKAPAQTREPSRGDRQQSDDRKQGGDRKQSEDRDRAKQTAPAAEEKSRRDRQPAPQETQRQSQPERRESGKEKAPPTPQETQRQLQQKAPDRRESGQQKAPPSQELKRETIQRKDDDRSRQDRERVERRDRNFHRDDPRVQERARSREQQKTSVKEFSKIRVDAGRDVRIDGGTRTLIREGDRIVIRHDDTRRLWGRGSGDPRVERLSGGQTRTIVARPDGSQIITITDDRGRIIRRYRRDPRGREIVFIEDVRRPPLVQLNLPPLVVNIPRERYIVDSRRASRRDFETVLFASPVEPVERAYSLYEVQNYDRIRDKMPRIDLLNITFDTDSAFISPDQAAGLEEIAAVMLDAIDRNPAEVFLIEGHTDATGDRLYNLALSDRRAEAVAFALTEYFDVPPENLVTQGYGPDYPKVPTAGAERENRRVAVRRIGPLLAGQ